jgi:hypothetical protein
LALPASLFIVLVLATFGSFGAGFGLMTACTNAYNCTITDCDPCSARNTWLEVGWAAQGVLLALGVVLGVLGLRWGRVPALRRSALLLGPVSVVLFVVTTIAASLS